MVRKFKKCLITGISGSGGSYLAEYILNKKNKTKLYGFYRNKKNLDYIHASQKKKIKLIKLDLVNFNLTKKYLKKIKPDLIFHLASDADVRKSFDSPYKIINNNNNITLNLLEALRNNKLNPLIIICSTSEVYGMVNKSDIPIVENQIFKPASPYALSKAFQDLLAQVYSNVYKQKIIITRMFSYVNPKRTNLFQTSFADQIIKYELKNNSKKFLFHGNLNSVRTFIDIKDAMRAYWMVAIKGKIGRIYNIGGKEVVTVKNVLNKLIKISNSKIKTKLDKKLLRPVDVTLQIPSSKKFTNDTNWRPKISLNQSLINLLDYRRKKNYEKK
tara:strand:- start:439 stop:1425 length:987 start_codon:yes stop_codon:yes gene_type:complete